MKKLILAWLATTALALGQATIDPANAFAWSANAGWIHLRPTAPDGVKVGEYHLSGKAYGANFGWISFGASQVANGYSYSNTSAADFGVNQDGAGNLSGWAYAANAGWIRFGWAGPTDANRPRIDLSTGNFSGYAWSANLGWIRLGTGLKTLTIQRTDSDGDGIGDEWEMAYFGNLTTAGATTDFDHDGVSDRDEYLADTRPDVRTAPLRLEIVSVTRGSGSYSATLRWNSQASRSYELQISPDLQAANWVTGGVFQGSGGVLQNVAASAQGIRFFRLRPRLPLSP